MKKMILIAMLAFAGCTTVKDKLHKVETPDGYLCKTHGANEYSYKLGTRYFCTICVDENLGQVELFLPAGDPQ